MNAALETRRVSIPIKEVWVSPGRRPVNIDAVQRLSASISEIGLQHAITVRQASSVIDPNEGEIYDVIQLIAGRHRLEACKALGFERIDVVFVDMDATAARMWEISENLHRAELTTLERSEQISEYAELAKKKRAAAQVAPPSRPDRVERGDRAAARDLGIDRDAVRRAQKVAAISPEAKEAAIEAGFADNQSKLLKIAAAPAEQQPEIVRRLSAAQKPPKVAADPLTDQLAAEKQVARLMDAWNAAGPDARAEFLLRIEQPVMDRRFA